MKTFRVAADFLRWRKGQSETLGFVPTLGALHGGHFSLIKKSKGLCRFTVVSIFLNPTQFSPDEDLTSYPQNLNLDIIHLKNLGVDVLFLPTEEEMYKKVGDVIVESTNLFNKLEGSSRPHFFYGVTTVVAKLFNIIQPSYAFFGEKDAQQLRIIKQMIVNMKYPIVLISCSIVRNKEGLALSSRNQHLTNEQKHVATEIYKGLIYIKQGLDEGQKILKLKEAFHLAIDKVPNMTVDYLSFACSDTLEEINQVTNKSILVSTAVFFHNIRLIDNFTYLPST